MINHLYILNISFFVSPFLPINWGKNIFISAYSVRKTFFFCVILRKIFLMSVWSNVLFNQKDYTHNVAGSTNDTRGWFLLFNIKLFLQRTDKQRLRTTDLFIGFWNYFSNMIYQGFPSRSFHLSFQRKQINESFPKFRTSASLRTHLKLSTHPF